MKYPKPLLITVLTLLAASSSCVNIAGTCENSAEKEVISPDGRLKAVVYNRGCGATTGFITGVSILPFSQPLTNGHEGNVLLAGNIVREFSRDNSNALTKGDMNFDAKWEGNSNLTIYYSESKFLEKRERFEDVEIRFLPISDIRQ